MRIRGLRAILRPAVMAAAVFWLLAPGIARSSEDPPSPPQRDAGRASVGELGTGVPTRRESTRRAHIYTSVIVSPLLLGYTEAFLSDREKHSRRLREPDMERMDRIYHEAFVSHLNPDYPTTEVPGPDVLKADALLIDHFVDKSDWLSAEQTTFRSTPKVQVVVFLRDSETDELIDTLGLTLPPRSGRLMRDGPGSYWNYMGLVFDRLATRVRWALEDQLK